MAAVLLLLGLIDSGEAYTATSLNGIGTNPEGDPLTATDVAVHTDGTVWHVGYTNQRRRSLNFCEGPGTEDYDGTTDECASPPDAAPLLYSPRADMYRRRGGKTDMWVTSWDNTGVRKSTTVFGYGGGFRRRAMKIEAYGVKTNSAGEVFVAGKAGGGEPPGEEDDDDNSAWDTTNSADWFYVDDKKVSSEWDVFVLKYNSDGVLQKSVLSGAANRRRGESVMRGIQVDSNNKVWVAIYTEGDVHGHTCNQGTNCQVLVKHDSNLAIESTSGLGEEGFEIQPNGIEVDSSNNIWVTGSTNTDIEEGPALGTRRRRRRRGPSSSKALYLAKYNNANEYQSVQLIDCDRDDLSTRRRSPPEEREADSYPNPLGGMVIDKTSEANIWVAGYVSSNCDGQTLSGTEDMFLMKFNSGGELQSTFLKGASGASTGANGITADSSGYIYVMGQTTGTLNGQTLTGDKEVFLIKFDASTGSAVTGWPQALLGARRRGGLTFGVGGGIAMDPTTDYP